MQFDIQSSKYTAKSHTCIYLHDTHDKIQSCMISDTQWPPNIFASIKTTDCSNSVIKQHEQGFVSLSSYSYFEKELMCKPNCVMFAETEPEIQLFIKFSFSFWKLITWRFISLLLAKCHNKECQGLDVSSDLPWILMLNKVPQLFTNTLFFHMLLLLEWQASYI